MKKVISNRILLYNPETGQHEPVDLLRSDDGEQPTYVLPTASETTKGGVMIGYGLQMDGDVVSVNPQIVPAIDATLEIVGAAAEAAATGQSLAALKEQIDGLPVSEPTILWSGSVSAGGQASVPGLTDWHIVLIYCTQGRMVLSPSNSGMTGSGANVTPEGELISTQLRSTYADGVLSIVACSRYTHTAGGTHGAKSDISLERIIGLIRK